LGGEVIHGHLAGHREPQIQRILLGPLVVHSNSLPDTWVSNLESAPPLGTKANSRARKTHFLGFCQKFGEKVSCGRERNRRQRD
ncbi:hypothetical protein, partial [Adlercreutzia sp.]|uniref:hypothetical protein n=1 Tax=Adlercreutzia sp. TaxID=1872387 RepID=UPI003AAEDDFC